MTNDTTKLAKVVIAELGGVTKVAGICHVRPQSVVGWRKKGIPDYRVQFLRLAYPKLKAWSIEA